MKHMANAPMHICALEGIKGFYLQRVCSALSRVADYRCICLFPERKGHKGMLGCSLKSSEIYIIVIKI